MTAYEEVLSPLVDLIVSRVTATVRQELQRTSSNSPDRSLDKKETAELLGLTPQTLMAKIQCGTVPPPYTARGELPKWSMKTIEKYMSGEWGNKK